MSEAKFTKGPWVAISNGSYFNIGPANEDSIVPVYPDVCIGVMHHDEANAYLIAAAPEMYEMLEDFKDFAISQGWKRSIVTAAEEILAKARGES